MPETTETLQPPIEHVIFSGVGIIEMRNGKRALVIYASREDAHKDCVSREIAQQLFPHDVFAVAGGCRENWGWFGSKFSCENSGCTKTCVVQVNKLDGLGWVSKTEGSIPVAEGAKWAFRCHCE